MTPLRALELIVTLLGIISAVFAGYWALDKLHAKQADLVRTEVELRKDIVNRDIKKDAEARAYYKNISSTRALEPAEESRLEYLEEQLEQKYEEQRALNEAELRLK